MNYITDAHALLWHLYWPQRLGSAAQRVFSDADAGQVCIYVPAVSDNYPLSPLLPETVIASHQYTTIPDIFDRLIVTEAISRGVPLVTHDPVIRQSGLISTVWD